MDGKQCALRVLNENIRIIDDKAYLFAGHTRLRFIAVRDACLSAKALIMSKHAIVVENLALLYVSHLDHSFCPIESFDSMGPTTRTLVTLMIPSCNTFPTQLKPNRNPLAYDTHLWILYSITYLDSFKTLVSKHKKEFQHMLDWYKNYVTTSFSLIHQPAFSGMLKYAGLDNHHHFMTNLLLFEVQMRWTDHLVPIIDQIKLQTALLQMKNDQFNVFRTTHESKEHISLDGNLFAVLWNLGHANGIFRGNKDAIKKHFMNLKISPLGTGQAMTIDNSTHDCCWFNRFTPSETTARPGFATYPDFQQVSDVVRIMGISTYHSSLYWTWLVGLYVEVHKRVLDTVPKNLLQHMVTDSAVFEVTSHHSQSMPIKTCLFQSEECHSLGAAFVFESHETQHKTKWY
jgi:L-rhamnose mutarotase